MNTSKAMKRTSFFSDENTAQLQLKVNEWLAENKQIGIIESGMSSAQERERPVYCFYILYELMEAAEAVAISEQLENIVPEINALAGPGSSQLQ
jgi:hypothetical protein